MLTARHTHSLIDHAHTLSLSHTQTHPLCNRCSLPNSLVFTHFSLSLTHTHTHTFCFAIYHSHAHSRHIYTITIIGKCMNAFTRSQFYTFNIGVTSSPTYTHFRMHTRFITMSVPEALMYLLHSDLILDVSVGRLLHHSGQGECLNQSPRGPALEILQTRTEDPHSASAACVYESEPRPDRPHSTVH